MHKVPRRPLKLKNFLRQQQSDKYASASVAARPQEDLMQLLKFSAYHHRPFKFSLRWAISLQWQDIFFFFYIAGLCRTSSSEPKRPELELKAYRTRSVTRRVSQCLRQSCLFCPVPMPSLSRGLILERQMHNHIDFISRRSKEVRL